MGLPFSIPNPTKCKAQGLTDVPSLTISLSKRALTNTHPLVHRDGSKLGRAVRWVKTFLVILDWKGEGGVGFSKVLDYGISYRKGQMFVISRNILFDESTI